MKKFIKRVTSSLLLVPAITLGIGFAAPVAVGAQSCTDGISGGIQAGANCGKGDNTPQGNLGDIFKLIVNVLLYIIGAVAVIMLIIGGIRYVTSGGDSSAVTAAKNTILYAVIGIIVALLAYAIVNFVIGAVLNPGGTT